MKKLTASVLLCAAVSLWFLLSCSIAKELQVSREHYTLLAVDTVHRDGVPMAQLTWLNGFKNTLTEFKEFPVLEKPGYHYSVFVVRNYIK